MPLLAGSSAIDAGNDSTCAATDQQGVSRPQGAHCDIGAYEVVDTTAPFVTSITRLNPNPTNLASVVFSVTFSEPVSSVKASDFNMTANGVTGAAISSVSGGASVYAVTVNTGTGNGNIRLDMPNSATITDLAGNPLAGLPYISGENYTIDKTAPAVVSSLCAGPNPTIATSVNYTVKFSEAVTDVDTSDFDLTTNGTSVSGVSGSGSIYTVTVSTGSGSGTIRLDVVDTDDITDLALNPLGGVGAGNGNFGSGESYNVRFYQFFLPVVAK